MQFDNPMPTFEPDTDPDKRESVDLDYSEDDGGIGLQDQLRSQVESGLNVRSVLHGTFAVMLLFVLFVLFLEVEFDILEHEYVNVLVVLVVILGGVSTIVKSPMDDMVHDPNYVAPGYWRFIVFIFFIISEIFLFLLVDDLALLLTIEGLAVLAGLVGAMNMVVLWQFAEEEFEDYKESESDQRTVVSNYLAMVVISLLLFVVRDNLPTIKPVTNALSLFLFLLYSGFFWTYALFDRQTINVVSRTILSFLISIVLLPLSLLLVERLGLNITPVVIVIANFVLCTLGFLAYNSRRRLKRWLYAG